MKAKLLKKVRSIVKRKKEICIYETVSEDMFQGKAFLVVYKGIEYVIRTKEQERKAITDIANHILKNN